MDSYGQFCPVAQAAEIIAERWTPLVLRELACGSHRFNDLHRGVPRMSRSLLARRLRNLEASGVIERRLVGRDAHPEYYFTEAGEELRPLIFELGSWGKRWVQHEISRDVLDAGLLMWDIHRRIQHDRLPTRPLVVLFCFPDDPEAHQRYWLMMARGQVDLCLQDPGCAEDLYVRASVATLTDVWVGDLSLQRAVAEGRLRIDGEPDLRHAFGGWLGLSVFAPIKRKRGRAGAAPTLAR